MSPAPVEVEKNIKNAVESNGTKKKKKLLVTGASGFLGWNICAAAQKQWSISGTVFSHDIPISGITTIQADVTNYKTVKALFSNTCPDAVIHTAAITDPNYCQENRSETEAINVDGALHIAGMCADNRVPCVFTSTDLVFNGLTPPYTETDQVSPVSFYGEQKVLAESGMMRRYPEVAICRLPLMFGSASPTSTSFIQPMIQNMRTGKELRLFVDEWRTPVSAYTAIQGMLMALEQVQGVIHLGGKERISRYDFGVLLKAVCGIKKAKLIACQRKDVVMAAPRPSDVSLDSSKAFGLGFEPLLLAEELKKTICQVFTA